MRNIALLAIPVLLLAASCKPAAKKEQAPQMKGVILLDEPIDLSTQKEIEASVKRGLKFLLSKQMDNGSWNQYPAITALVASGFLQSNPTVTDELEPVAKALKFLESCAKPDGSIHIGDMDVYNTSICIETLKDSKDARYKPLIEAAERFLMKNQLDADESIDSDSLWYGGCGYGGDTRPDLSNLQWALEALAKQPYDVLNPEQQKPVDNLESEKVLFYGKALEFLNKCQNLKSVNSEAYAGNDGGFMYEPGASKAGGSKSYGSMSYAGLKSMIYARLTHEDPRVEAAYQWISGNFRVDSAPNMGNQGLYYYYLTMARGLSAYGTDVITTPENKQINWRMELANQLLKTQTAEGFWVNENGRWWENDPVLVTAYVVLTLEELLKKPRP